MVFLSALLALAVAQASDAPPPLRPWGRDHIGVSLLPIPPHPLASRVRQGVADGIEPGVVLVPLTDDARTRLVDHPACRDRPRCVHEVLPPGLRLALDVRVEGRGADTRLMVRVLENGTETERRSIYVRPDAVAATLAMEVRSLLQSHHLDYQWYAAAVTGDTNAGARLEERYPDSPWTAAWRQRSDGP